MCGRVREIHVMKEYEKNQMKTTPKTKSIYLVDVHVARISQNEYGNTTHS